MQTRRKGLVSWLVAVETGSIPLWRQCNAEGKSSEGHLKDNLYLPPPTSAWLCCCCIPFSFFSFLPDSLPLFSSAQVPPLVLVGLFSSFLFRSQLFPLPFYPRFIPLPWVNAPWWSFLPRHNYRLIFRCFFFLLRHWEQDCVPTTVQPWQYCYQFLYFKRPEFILLRKPCYASASSQFCLLVPPSTRSFGTHFPSRKAAAKLFLHKEFWFPIAPKIPSLWFNKGTGHIQSFCYISAPWAIWLILEACSAEFISLLQHSKRSINVLRTQEVSDTSLQSAFIKENVDICSILLALIFHFD